MAKTMRILKLVCKRCKHTWAPRREEVRVCPRCKSPYWDKDKNEK